VVVGLIDGTTLEFTTASEVPNLKFKGTSSGYGPSGQPSPVTSWKPKPPEEIKAGKAPLDLTERPPWGANQPKSSGPESSRKQKGGMGLPPALREDTKGGTVPTLLVPPPQSKPLSAFIPPSPPTPNAAKSMQLPPPSSSQAPPPLPSLAQNTTRMLDKRSEALSVFGAVPQTGRPYEQEQYEPFEGGMVWRETIDIERAEEEAPATAMNTARAKAAEAIQAAEVLDLESVGGQSTEGDGPKYSDPKDGPIEPCGNKIRRRLELLNIFSEISVQSANGERVVEVENLTVALERSSDPVLRRCLSGDEVKLEGGLTWEHCVHILHMQEPAMSDDGSILGSKLSATWFGRDASTIIMDVAIQDREFELLVADGTVPEEMAKEFIEANAIEKRFFTPLLEQVRASTLQVNREELDRVRIERDQAVLDLLRVESVLVDRERRAASLLFNLDGKVGKRTMLELSKQVADLKEKLAVAQANSPLVANISSSLNDQEQLARARSSHKFRLETIYAFKAPEKLLSVDATLQKFKGHEETLFQMIETKYGEVHPLSLVSLASKKGSSSRNDEQKSGDVEAEFKSADSDGDGIISKDEWRRWNMEKQKLMRDANADRERLMSENRRLRSALNPDSIATIEKERQRAEALHELEAQKIKLNAEKSTLVSFP
jgi:hypothetical protein